MARSLASTNGRVWGIRSVIRQVAYTPPQANTLIIDKNGYIGSKLPTSGNTYYATLDKNANYSQSQLGQVTIIIPEIGEVEIGGRVYKTTKIGNQIWLAENLDYKFNVDGSQIPIGSSGTPTTPAAWYYNNNEADYGIDGTYKCGLLYNWYAAKYLDDNKSILLPNGWHVPNRTELTTLINSIGNYLYVYAINNSIVQGFPNNWNGVDIYEMNITPSGVRFDNSNFISFNTDTVYWTSEESSDTYGYNFWTERSSISMAQYKKVCGYQVRLVKDVT